MMDKAEPWAKKLDVDLIRALGEGINGVAWLTSDQRVLKITSSANEAAIAFLLKGTNPRHFARIDDLVYFGVNDFGTPEYGILQEYLSSTLEFEEAADSLDTLADNLNCCFTHLIDRVYPYNDLSCMELDIINAIDEAVDEADQIGFHPGDIFSGNMGLKSDGRVAFFDQEDQSLNGSRYFSELVDKIESDFLFEDLCAKSKRKDKILDIEV